METVDIVIPTYNRLPLLQRCLDSVFEKTTGTEYRLFIVDDCSNDGTQDYLAKLEHPNLETVILNKKRRGLTYNFDALWSFIKGHDWFYNTQSEYLCLLQDDTEICIEYWHHLLVTMQEILLEQGYNLGFLSGFYAPEHQVVEKINDKVLLTRSMRATNMIGTWAFWESIGRVPRLQPNGTDRGFPTANVVEGQRGRGSNFDVYLTGCNSKGPVDFGRTIPTSSFYQGKLCLVLPGLIKHCAPKAEDSTWGNTNIV